MNIHYSIVDGVIAPIATGLYRQRTGERRATNKGTKTPNTRPGKSFPGGKQLRRAFTELHRRRKAQQATISSMGKGKSINPLAFQQPGSMKTRAR